MTDAAPKDNKLLFLGIALALLCCGAVPVIGVVAAIAVPNFLAMQLRAKRAEAPTNVDGMRTAEKAYHAEWDAFTSVAVCPPFEPGRTAVMWEPSWACYDQFSVLGWLPDGPTRCQYLIEANNESSSSVGHDFVIESFCDVDGDGTFTTYMANRAQKATMTSPNNQY